MSDKKLYIAGMGLMTAAGADVPMNIATVKAGLNRYRDSGYFTRQKQPIKMALIPDDALPALKEEVMLFGAYSLWAQRLLKIAATPLMEAVANASGEAPLPLILACPEHYAQWPHSWPETFIKNLVLQCGAAIDLTKSRTVQTGRAGFIEALKLAERFLYETDCQEVLVGGVDSLQRPELFRGWLDYGRISGSHSSDTFVPGEGAGFLLLSRTPEGAIHADGHTLYLVSPSMAEEPGHLYSEADYLGEGLSAAASQTLTAFEGGPIRGVYSTMNGESFWSKELGVMLTRCSDALDEDFELRHPADCYGDLGAASAAALVVLAADDVLQSPKPMSHLVCASSDHQYRGSVALSLEPASQTSDETSQEFRT